MSEIKRQNWNMYKDIIKVDSLEYEILWNDLYEKYNINKTDAIVEMLQDFIMGKFKKTKNKILYDDNTLILKKVKGEKRKKIHELCNIIGLHHESKNVDNEKYEKDLYIYKPAEWLWEFTARNPYSKSEEFYKKKNNDAILRKEKREIDNQIKKIEEQKKREEDMENEMCDICGITGKDAELYICLYGGDICCALCLESTLDKNGHPLSCHKCESLRDFL